MNQMPDYQQRVATAVKHFWRTREQQQTRQASTGKTIKALVVQ